MKKLGLISFFVGCICFVPKAFSQPGNDACASATTLTIGGSLSCGQTTEDATLQTGECFTNYAGSSEGSAWYRVDATNDSLVLNFVVTNTENCNPHIRIYGPFADGAGCTPACASAVYSVLQSGDPGSHILLTGLTTTTGGNDYLIQIQGNDCGGPDDGFSEYCISAASPATNNTAATATLIDECGTAFSNSTNGGYYNQGTSTGFNNLDGNNTTTCGTCAETGDDTPFVVNNVSWSTFCSLTTGTWQITVNGISNCTLASPNQGVQASVFTGTSSSLTNVGNSASPLAPGASFTSSTLTVNSGECAFLMIDGFAGDACDYSVTLTNISGGCIILPIGLTNFNVYSNENAINLSWEVYSELDNAFFTVERSLDGNNFTPIATIQSIGNHSQTHTYYAQDRSIETENLYYRLSATDINGETTVLAVKYFKGKVASDNEQFLVYPNPSKDVVNFEFNYPMAEAQAKVEIYNVTGSVYESTSYTIQNGLNNLSYSFEHLPEGNYIIRVTTPYRVYTSKILKQAD